jgi:hypothetical protein
MFAEADVPHHRPHFHAYYQDHAVSISLDTIEVLAGALPRKQQRLVEAWAEIHQDELRTAWQLLVEGNIPPRIEPL